MLYSFENRLVFRAEAQQPSSGRKPSVIIHGSHEHIPASESHTNLVRKKIIGEILAHNTKSVENLSGYPDAIRVWRDFYIGKDVKCLTKNGEFTATILGCNQDQTEAYVRINDVKDSPKLFVNLTHVKPYGWEIVIH